MTDPKKPPEGRYVKGSLMLDYVKTIKANPDLPWSDHLLPEDVELIKQYILPASWYPMEQYQRIGLAVFKLLVKENYEFLYAYGRSVADKMNADNPGLVVEGRARDTLVKYRAIQDRGYSFKAVETDDVGPGHIIVHILSAPEEKAAKLLIEIVSGTIGRLIELSGGKNVKIKLTESVWEGADQDSLEITWEE
jgi:hypothetical protein